MKWLKYQLMMILLNYQYGRKLAKVSRDRFKNCKRGLQAAQRQVVHNWAAGERHRIYTSIYGAK